ncbi:MAG: carboxypeptidase regulatory-like domain-containing protein, partial [Calditrichaeota bacterium]
MTRKSIRFTACLAALLLFSSPAYQQEKGRGKLHFSKPLLNENILRSKQNLDASIVLTKVPRDLFIDGDTKTERDIEWTPSNVTCVLRYGTRPGDRDLANYPFTLNATGTGRLTLNPGKENLRTGVYYCILVAENDSSLTSVEFKVIVQANAVAVARSPLGKVDLQQGPPLFSWDPVEGVPYYFLLLSEGPLSIDRDENGKIVGVTGVNLIWQVITPSTFVRYGDPDPSGNFINAHVPPLLPNIEYNWIILNSYSAEGDLITGDVAPVAPLFFEVERPTLPTPPRLLQPAADQVVTGNTISFRWNPVPNVTHYRLFLYETRKVSTNEISFAMWSQVTSDTEVELQAKDFLVNTGYHWRVVAENENGLVTSEYRPFTYGGPSGVIQFFVTSAEGPLSRVKLEVRNEANSELLVPFLTDSLGISETVLPVGEYSYTASKVGFVTTQRDNFRINDGSTTFVTVEMARASTTLSGRVVDETGRGLLDATV